MEQPNDKPKGDTNSTNTNDSVDIQILLNEYNQCNDRIEAFLNRQDNMLQIMVAIIGGAAIYGLLKPLPDELYLLIPMIPFLFIGHIGYHYVRIIANQGYKLYLTEILNSRMNKNEYIKYSYLTEKYLLNDNSFAKLNFVILVTIIIASFVYAIVMSHFSAFGLIYVGGIPLLLMYLYGAYKKYCNFNSDIYDALKGNELIENRNSA